MKTEKINTLVSQLTLDEKIGMIHGNELFRTKGVERLGIPPLTMSDGPMGVRQDYDASKWNPKGFTYDQSSYLPSNTALAATWNPTLAYETGKILGKETRGRGKDMILAPGINIQRSPLCGRNFEYMGEDPYLVSQLVVPMIQGIEENDVSSCVKHFALNNQETRRLDVDVEVSERALHEIYLPAFKAAVKKGKAKGFMGSYNKFRGQHCCHHEYLVNQLLKEQWGFDGIYVSDWGGAHDTLESVYDGLDVEMSVTDNFDEYYMAEPLKQMIEDGIIPESSIDDKVRRILHVMNTLHMLDGERQSGAYNVITDRESMLQVARESIVLLKNEKNVLPLDSKKGLSILVVGDNANRQQAPGGGSAEIKALYEITPLLGIMMEAGGNVTVSYEQGYEANTSGNIYDEEHTKQQESWQATSLEQSSVNDKYKMPITEEMIAHNKMLASRAVEAAKKADIVIFVGGLNHEQDTEGKDRECLELPYEQDNLIQQLLEVNEKTIITILSGSPVSMEQWQDKAHTLLQCWYAGMEGGHALGEVIFGKVNPSGKLPETFPINLLNAPAHTIGQFPGDDCVKYLEGVFIGYRYYDTKQVSVAFPFGYGLSYTTFSISDMNVVDQSSCDNVSIKINVTIKNNGAMYGAETVQLYVHANDSLIERPYKELRGFKKVFLHSLESTTITLELDELAFTYFDEEKDCFFAEKGSYTIFIGNDSSNMILNKEVTLQENYTIAK